MENKVTINNLDELTAFAQELLKELGRSNKERATVVALTGDFGAGKTTLVQALAKQLGIFDIVTSPTFVIMKKYQTNQVENFSQLLHMDAYRIEDINELGPLRLAEILKEPNTLACIEWAEKIASILPINTLFLTIEIIANSSREITIKREERGV